jgi:hypothetical protein
VQAGALDAEQPRRARHVPANKRLIGGVHPKRSARLGRCLGGGDAQAERPARPSGLHETRDSAERDRIR